MKNSTKCPGCEDESADCQCGLSMLMRRNYADVKRGVAEVLVMPSMAPDNPEIQINAVAVVLHDCHVVEQWFGNALMTTMTVAPEGIELVWDTILSGLRARSTHRIGGPTLEDYVKPS